MLLLPDPYVGLIRSLEGQQKHRSCHPTQNTYQLTFSSLELLLDPSMFFGGFLLFSIEN